MIGRELLRDAAARRQAEDVDGCVERLPERGRVLARQRAHAQRDGQPGTPIDVEHTTAARPWLERLLVHPAHRPRRDPGVR